MIKFSIPISLVIFSCSHRINNETIKNKLNTNNIIQNSIDSRDYISKRDSYIKYFHSIELDAVDWGNKNDSILIQEEKAIIDLENKLKELLINAKVTDAQNSKINLNTLFDDYGFGLMDGLISTKDKLTVFYTTVDIFLDFFKNQNLNEFNELTSQELELILNEALFFDVHISVFYYQTVAVENDNLKYAILCHIGQGESYEPNIIFSITKNENIIYITEQSLNIEIDKHPDCYLLLDSILSNSNSILERFYQSGELDSLLDFNSIAFRDFAYKKYRDCFQQNFPITKNFDNIKQQMEELAAYY